MSSQCHWLLGILSLSLCGIGSQGEVTTTSKIDLRTLAQEAVSAEPATAHPAVERLRAVGPAGLDALFAVHEKAVREVRTGLMGKTRQESDEWKRLAAAFDAVGKQRDCYASHLYWYTDFEQAKAAAKASGKPILSLRLLGNLDEEFSCANSRFFRTVLYANEEVSRTLRERFVLHWKSVRPVPKVTIDFGDGRKLERTITGNSIHYILDCEGRVVDALPGLYGPKAFLRGLMQAEETVTKLAGLDVSRREIFLRQYHQARLGQLTVERDADLAKLANPATSVDIDRLDSSSNLYAWPRIAQLHAADSRLDSSSKSLMRSKTVSARDAARVALSKTRVEDPMLKVLVPFERSVAEDTVRNEYVLHAKLHGWMAADTVPQEVDALNEKVYTELFLTPSSDPWLGLVPGNTYTALESNGLSVASSAPGIVQLKGVPR